MDDVENDLEAATRQAAYDAIATFAADGDTRAIERLIKATSKENRDIRSAIHALGKTHWENVVDEERQRLSYEAVIALRLMYFDPRPEQADAKTASDDMRIPIITSLGKIAESPKASVRVGVIKWFIDLLIRWINKYGTSGQGPQRIVIPEPVVVSAMGTLSRIVLADIAEHAQFDVNDADEDEEDGGTLRKTRVRNLILTVDLAGTAIRNNELSDLVNKLASAAKDISQVKTFASIAQKKVRLTLFLDLSRTGISNAGIPGLERLNAVESLIAGVKINLQARVKINLSGTPITDEGLQELVKLKGLKELDLSNTNIGDCGLAILANLTGLETLNLAKTKITDCGLRYLRSLRNLKTLDLSDTKIGDAGLVHLAGLALVDLKLSGTKIGDAGIAHLEMSQIKTLDLSSTAAGDGALAHLNRSGLDTLKTLKLAKTRITDQGLGHLSKPGLKNLDLSGTYVGDMGLALVTEVATLETLNVSGTLIGDCSLDRLTRLKEIQILNLSTTLITDRGLKRLGEIAGDLGFGGKDPKKATENSKKSFELHINNNDRISYNGVENLRAALRVRPKLAIYSSLD